MSALNDPEIEGRMIDHLVRLMIANDAPLEQYQRLGLGDEYRRISGATRG